MRKRAHWIVFTLRSPRREYLSMGLGSTESKFYYLECTSCGIFRWTENVTNALRFTKPKAVKEAACRGASIDFHPDFRYAE